LHPSHEFSYAPAQIIQVPNNTGKLTVRFYDYVEAVCLVEEVFKLQILKFQYDIDIINKLESKWIGLKVLARNNHSSLYEIGL
jgi:hypothetical protein